MARELDLLRAAGREGPVRVFELVATRDVLGPRNACLCERFRVALTVYRACDCLGLATKCRLEAPLWAGHIIHIVRDTDYGCEMRSRFWIGDFDPPEIATTRQERLERIPDRLGWGLLKHCHEEMGYLQRFSPGYTQRKMRSYAASVRLEGDEDSALAPLHWLTLSQPSGAWPWTGFDRGCAGM